MNFLPQNADMGLDDMTITSQRSQVVDFSTPYQTSSLKIMVKVSIYLHKDSYEIS